MARGGGPKKLSAKALKARGSKPSLIAQREKEERQAQRVGVPGLTKSRAIPACPKALKGPARALFLRIVREYTMEDPYLEILIDAAFLTQTIHQARQLVAQEGIVIQDKRGKPMQHPACLLERHSVALRAKLLKQIDLPED